MLDRFGGADNCLKHMTRSRREVLALLENLNDAQLFARPNPQTWSPAEVLEHVAYTEMAASKVIRRMRQVALGQADLPPPPAPIQTRPDGRRVAPPDIEPKGLASRQELLELLQNVRQRLHQEVAQSQEAGLLEHPLVFSHPGFGPLSALGWLQSVVYHERHHLDQIRLRLG